MPGHHRVRRVLTALLVLVCGFAAVSCSEDAPAGHRYGAQQARIGESLQLLGWNLSVANLRFAADRVLIDVDGAPADPEAAHADGADLRFGLYGALAHPIEATGVGSCDQVAGTDFSPLLAQPDRVSGTVCLGPIRDQAQVRGVYVYSPQDRIPQTLRAYPAAFPLGLPTTSAADTGLMLSTTSVEAWRANGTPLVPADLGDNSMFTGDGYMLLGLQIDADADDYQRRSAERGGPLMVTLAPSLPPPGLSAACSTYGASVLVLPEASLSSVQLKASLCAQGEISTAVLYATVSVLGTHAGVWLQDEQT